MDKSRVNKIINICFAIGLVVLFVFPSARTTVVSTLQRGLLQTGLMNAKATTANRQNTIDRSLALATLDGIPLDSATLAGKSVFLHFWASWCPPCVAELPDVQQLVQSMSAEEVVFLLVTVEQDIDKERQFLQKKNYTDLPVYRPTGPLPAGLEHRTIPTTYVIAPSGDIIYHHEGLAQYNHDEFKQFLRSSRSRPTAARPVPED